MPRALADTDRRGPAVAIEDLAAGLLEDLALGRLVHLPVLIVTAHPDDETLAMGGRLASFARLKLLQLTDGAPICESKTRRAVANHRAYAAERERETQRALKALSVQCRRIRVGVPDQASVFFIDELLRTLERELRDVALVFTHPYEGGHPDHDTAALVVQVACDRIASMGGRPPARVEFASYHHRAGKLVAGQFWPDNTGREVIVALDRRMSALKRDALSKFRTQASVIEWFRPEEERYRRAPRYDFGRPPPPGVAQYDLFGWSITSARWRETAVSSIAVRCSG
jgi:N-acetylglucosamine malate deacetylase 2